eukprot:487771-Prymnesium_polylepis.1
MSSMCTVSTPTGALCTLGRGPSSGRSKTGGTPSSFERHHSSVASSTGWRRCQSAKSQYCTRTVGSSSSIPPYLRLSRRSCSSSRRRPLDTTSVAT